MGESREMSKREKALRKYFYEERRRSTAVRTLLLAALLIVGGLVVGPVVDQYWGQLAVVAGVILAGLGILLSLVRRLRSAPSDRKVDEWFEDAVDRLVDQSFGVLNLDKSEVVADPLVVIGPILWPTPGIDDHDLVWRVGNDDFVRFGAYGVTIILLTDRHMGIYACDYNTIRDVALNEETDEYHYQDIVSVSTKETASPYQLPTGMKLTTAQEFRISVTSGESVTITVGAEKLSELTGSDKMPETGAEKAVSVIRTMLREKKQ